MAISHVNSTTFASAGTTDTSVTNSVPSGVVDGDLLLWAFSGVASSDPATPSGWSTWANTTNGASSRIALFYRFASSEPGSYTASSLASGRWTGIMSAYRGVDQTTPKDATPVLASSATTPAITTVTANAYVVGHGKAISATGVTTTSWTSSNGTIAGQISQTQGAATNDTSGTTYLLKAVAGASTPNLVASGTLTLQARITSALRPATTLAATGTGSLSLAGAGAATAAASGTGALSLDASGSAAAAAAGTGALALAGAGAAQAPAAGTGALSLAGAGAARAAAQGTGSITLAGTGATSAQSTGTGSLTLGGSTVAGGAATAAGTLTLVGAGGGGALVVGTGSLSLAAAGAISASAGGTAQIVLSGTGVGHRAHAVADIDRLNVVEAEDRVTVIAAEDRVTMIPAENRYVEVT